GFLARVTSVLNGTLHVYQPAELFLIRLDNWFGQRWLEFSGKALGALGVCKSKLTLPPFVPHRVVSQHHYALDEVTAEYLFDGQGQAIHGTRPSADNLQRYVATIAPGAAFVWYSGSSTANGRGAVMMYIPAGNEHWAWYAAFARSVPWRITCLDGIS